jgi:regulator of protease activity HflC (stomatin/prohibitin superfamily)
MNTQPLNRILACAAIVGCAALSGCGYRNVETPPGYVGYVTKGSVLGSTRFEALQTGPTSSGLGFLLNVTNISVTPYTYSEDFNVANQTGVLAKDQLAVSFSLHITFRINPALVKDFVEKFSTLSPGGGDSPDVIVQTAYNNFVKEPARTAARSEVEKYDGLKVQDNAAAITAAARKTLEDSLRGTPFEIMNVVVGNIQYPPNVTQAVANKIATAQEFERQAMQLQIVTAQADQKRTEAAGIADAMKIINSRLTPEYIQYEAVKAQLSMVNGPNHTTIYIPVGPMGVPIVSPTGAMVSKEEPAPEAK